MQSNEVQIYHYPTDLFELLVKTISKLYWSKKGLIDFFVSSGVPTALINDLIDKVNYKRSEVYKHEIVREVLNRINQKTDQYLRQRREIIKRIVQFENYSSCCPDEKDEAFGLVAQVRELVNTKDSFTRMQQEKDAEIAKYRERERKKLEEKVKKKEELSKIKADFYSLFASKNPKERGKLLEDVLNRLFKAYEILVKEAFIVTGENDEGIVEQIDGAIQLNGDVYLVEMKWWKTPIDQKEVSSFIGKLFLRGQDSRGLFISYSDYTKAAISCCRDAKIGGVAIILSTLDEFVFLLDKEMELKEFLTKKIEAAITHKKPFYKPLEGDKYTV